MNVYEEERYPFLRDETRFLQEAAAATCRCSASASAPR